MYKLQTYLKNFRFNSIHNHGPYTITWFKLLEKDVESECVGLTHEELTKLTNYTASNKTNFDNANYYSRNEDDLPYFSEYDLLPLDERHPKFLILKQNPRLSMPAGKIFTFMEIELLNENGSKNHTYNLEFDIVGQVN
jgi:hypothetical protein